MSPTIYDLPDELLLKILRHVDLHSFVYTQRLVDRRFKAHADDILLNELLPTLSASLFVYTEYTHGDQTQSMGFNVELKMEYIPFSIQESQGRNTSGTVRFALCAADPPHRRDVAIKTWKSEESYGTANAVLRLCLPGHFVITYRGREWIKFSERTSRVDECLVLRWIPALASYLHRVKLLEDARLKPGPQFPLY